MIKIKSLLFQGHKLKQLRESRTGSDGKPLTMSDVEEATGIRQASQSEIETGKNKNPRPATVDRYCTFFDVDPIYFYYTGENISDLFPKEMSVEVKEFVFDIENIPYLELAVKIKKLGLKVNSANTLLTAYAKTISDNF